MCGIVAYIGKKQAYPILIKGLQRLEYRGYDSSGVALLNDTLNVYKKKGKVSELVEFATGKDISANIGIGHTRWATHGKPDDTNAHPHQSGNGRLVLVHLIEELQERENLPLEDAVRIALTKVVGAYAIVVLDKEDPNKIVAARKQSPLVLGIGEGEFLVASDATPLVEHTNRVVYLNDLEIVTARMDGSFEIKSISNQVQVPSIQKLDLEIEVLEKGGYDSFMLKEIHEQTKTIADAMRGRISAIEGWVKLGGLEDHINRILNADRLIIVACGTSWHAGLVAEYLLEEIARIPVEVEYASEFRYRNPIITERDVVIAISQSGETADTMAALELAKERGALLYGIVNVVGSSIARLTHSGSYIHAGPEIGVASTKAFTGQVTLLTLMALDLGFRRGTISKSDFHHIITEMENIPKKVEAVLKTNEQIKYIASEIKDSPNALYLGRGYNFPVALEGALKLKEISYIHAEGYPAAEMKHGPIALIDENMPCVIICTNKSAYEKIVSNIQEVKARKGIVIAIVTEGDTIIKQLADYTIEIPDTAEPLTPLLSSIPLQLLSYHIAVMRGCNVDQPRNLAKSVTVE